MISASRADGEIGRVALLGTGIMGAPMARHLARTGHELTVWNRSIEKSRSLINEGIILAPSAVDAVKDCDAVVVMLSSGSVCQDILFGTNGAANAMREGALLIVMSSIGVREAIAMAHQAENLGLQWLDAPVSGGEQGARQATLSIMVGGATGVFDQAVELLGALGTAHHVGPVGSGALCKLINQSIVASTLTVVAEALLLAERSGADVVRVRQALLGGFARSTILEQQGLRMIEGSFDPGGPARYQIKDTKAALEAATDAELELPMLTLADQLFTDLVEHGDGDLDHSAIIRQLRRRNDNNRGD